jgi:hypothetical protein
LDTEPDAIALEDIPAPPQPEVILYDDLLAQAGLMLQFIDAGGLSDAWRAYEVADTPQRRAEIAYATRMRLSPDL